MRDSFSMEIYQHMRSNAVIFITYCAQIKAFFFSGNDKSLLSSLKMLKHCD